MPEIAIFFIFLIAMFVQTSAGFGSALIAMPLLAGFLGTRTAAPLFSLSYICIAVVVTYRYRHDLQMKNIWRMLLAGLVAIPIGVHIISQLDENITLLLYGLFVIAYSLYALMGFRPPELKNRSPPNPKKSPPSRGPASLSVIDQILPPIPPEPQILAEKVTPELPGGYPNFFSRLRRDY